MLYPDAELAEELLSVDNALLDSQLPKMLEAVKKALGVEPYSKEFLFGLNPTHIAARNAEFAALSSGQVTLLDAMLRRRDKGLLGSRIADSMFDLGSKQAIPDNKKTLIELAKHVRARRKSGTNSKSKKDEFQDITRFVKKTFDRKYSDYDDVQNALRIVHLLDEKEFSLQSLKPKKRNLASLIKIPKTAYSFETRSHHPTKTGEFNSHFLRDLKAHASIEIDDKTRYTIDSFFNVVLARLDRILEHLEDLEIPKQHDSFKCLLEGMEFVRPANARPPSRLDCDLYFHLCRLELLHFSGSHREVLAKSQLPTKVKAIRKNMSAALLELSGHRVTYQDIAIPQFAIRAVPLLLECNARTILSLIEAALEIRIRYDRREQVFHQACELLHRKLLSMPFDQTPIEQMPASFLQIVSAVCAVAQARKKRMKFSPKYVGEETQAGSIVASLDSKIVEINNGPSFVVPEGFLQIWNHRMDRMQGALVGLEQDLSEKFELRKTIWHAFDRCMTARDFPEAAERYFALENFLTRFDPGKYLAN